jgi:hypothetical protein
MTLSTYDPKSVLVLVGVLPISGFADATFVEVARETDAFTKKVGADGYTTRTRSNNTSGSITITLMQSSPSNAALSALYLADQGTNSGVVPITIKDNSGTSLTFAPQSWVRKIPDQAFGLDLNAREWVFDCADLQVFVGGNS